MTEYMLRDLSFATDLRHVALRYFNVAGSDPQARVGEVHDPETHLIPLALEAALGKRNSLTVFGSDYPTPDGTCVRDYTHVVDLVDAHLASRPSNVSGKLQYSRAASHVTHSARRLARRPQLSRHV